MNKQESLPLKPQCSKYLKSKKETRNKDQFNVLTNRFCDEEKDKQVF